MPIILNSEILEEWLDKDTEVDKARELLTHNRGHELASHRIGRAVNSSRALGADLIEPLELDK